MKKGTRRLTLSRETLRSLSGEGGQGAAGGYQSQACTISLGCAGTIFCPASFGCTDLNSCRQCNQN